MAKTRRGRKPASRQSAASKSSGNSTGASPNEFAIPEPPEDLGCYGQQYWREHAELLCAAGILTPIHVQTFRVLCEQWQTYRALTSWLNDDPSRYTFITESGYESETPQVRQRDKALDQLQKLWLKFGLTPHALATLNKQRGKFTSQIPAITAFAKSKYE